jgi:hypothetical protein
MAVDVPSPLAGEGYATDNLQLTWVRGFASKRLLTRLASLATLSRKRRG